MKKRLVALFIAVALLVTVIGGCSKKDSATDAGNKGGSEVTKESGQTTEANGNFNETGYPVVKEPLVLTAVFNSHPNTYELMEMESFQAIAEKTGISLDVEAVRSGWVEKKNLIVASGVLPDIFFGEGLKDKDILKNKAYFVDMAPLIDKYAPNIKKMFEENPMAKKICTDPETGAIYGLPNVRPFRPKVADSWFINKQWLDTLGLDIPQNLEEFEAVLKAFKEQDPNQNGKADEIPFNFNKNEDITKNYFTWRGILGSYGVTNDRFGDNMQVRDGKVQFISTLDGYRDAVAYVHKLYEQGLVYPEVFTQSNYLASGKPTDIAKLGVGVVWQAKNLFGPWADQYVIMPPLEGPNGDRQVVSCEITEKYKKNVFSITTANKNPEATMRWIDEFYNEENSVQMFFGSIGPAVTKTDSGYEILDPPSDLKLSAGQWKWTAAPADRAPMYFSPSLEEKIAVPDFYLTKLSYDEPFLPYLEPVENNFPMVMWSPEVADELTILQNDIYKYVNTNTAKWITEGGIEEEWDNYKEQINKMGLKRLMEIYQEAYDNYMGN